MTDKYKLKTILICIACAAVGSYSAKLLFDHIAKQSGLEKKPAPVIKVTVTAPAVAAAVPPAATGQPPASRPVKKAPAAKETPPALGGIVFSPGSSYALINNKIVKEGDKIEDTAVARIAKDSVELKDGRVLKLKSGF